MVNEISAPESINAPRERQTRKTELYLGHGTGDRRAYKGIAQQRSSVSFLALLLPHRSEHDDCHKEVSSANLHRFKSVSTTRRMSTGLSHWLGKNNGAWDGRNLEWADRISCYRAPKTTFRCEKQGQ